MHVIRLALCCLAYVGYGRRVQTPTTQVQSSPSAAFSHTGLRGHHQPRGPRGLLGWHGATESRPKQHRRSPAARGSRAHTLESRLNCASSRPAGLNGQNRLDRRPAQISMSSVANDSPECEGEVPLVSMGARRSATTEEEDPKSWKSRSIFGFASVFVAKILSRIGQSIRRGSKPREAKGSYAKLFSKIDIPLLIMIALWYLGNYSYNITNKIALNSAGGIAGFPMTIATAQLGIGVLYAAFLWAAPDARPRPRITFRDYVATLPLGASTGAAHAAAVLALSAGAVSFAQIVKSAEPAFAALLGTFLYGAPVSSARWLCLVPVIAGVALASVSELDFAWATLAIAAAANVLSAVVKNESKKLMGSAGIADRLGSVGNQFAITTINSFLFCLPLMLLTEGRKLGVFVQLCKTQPALLSNLILSGLWAYLYSELATIVIKKTSAVTQSVLSALKRVTVIIVVALAMGESLGPLKLLACGMSIGGVFLYSIIDDLVAKKSESRVRGVDFGVQHYVGISSTPRLPSSAEANTVTLKSKGELIPMPIAGLGLWKSKPEEAEEAIAAALICGVRLLDSAAVYENEKEVGKAIASNCKKLGIARDDLFIVSKLFNTHHVWDGDVSRVVEACDQTLEDLGVDYVDLYMMHWPFAFLQTDLAAIGGLRLEDGTPNPKLIYQPEFIDTYREMIKLLNAGKCRALGVCNLTKVQLEELIQRFPEYPPSVLQCELHPYLSQNELVRYCADKGIAVMAYSPLGSGDSYSGKSFPEVGSGSFQNLNAGTTLLENPVVAEIATRVGRSPAQVLIRWCIQRNIVCIPKSVRAARIKENYSVLDWALGDEDVAKLNSLDCGFRYSIGYGPGHYDCPNAPWYSSSAANP